MLVEPLNFVGDPVAALSSSQQLCPQVQVPRTQQCKIVCSLKQLYEKLVHLGHEKSPKEVDFKCCRQQNTSKLHIGLSV